MTLGGTLKVANNYGGSFTVSFARNTEITNFSDREMNQEGDVKAQVKGGRGVTHRVYSSGMSGELATLDLNTKRYAIFDTLRKLDGNAGDVSEKDLANAKSLIGKNGVKNVKIDKKTGVTTILCDDGAVLRFDVETDEEKQVREKAEAQEALRRQEAAKAEEEKKQQKAAKYNEMSKTGFEKVEDAIIYAARAVYSWFTKK